MSKFKLSNKIFSLGLDAKELSVYAYLCSIQSQEQTITGEAVVYVKQTTIAEKCSVRSVQTVAKIIARLSMKGLVSPLNRAVKHDGFKGTYFYGVKKLPLDSGYFFVDRKVLGILSPRQMYVYLFLCKSFDMRRNDCWNSYNDISEQTGMKRETIIQTIRELVEHHLIVRMRRKSKENHHVFVDNHYQLVRFETGHIKKGKIKERLYSQYNRSSAKYSWLVEILGHYQYTMRKRKCQAISENLFLSRGSPKSESHIRTQDIYCLKEKKISIL